MGKTTAGVYLIRCVENGKVYVGQSATIEKRWREHVRDLRAGDHHTVHLQRAWDKYGEDAFEFQILCDVKCDKKFMKSILLSYEQLMMDVHRSADPEFGFNDCPAAGSPLGRRHTDEAREKIGAAHRGKPKSPETKAKIGDAHRGRRHDPEHIAKMAASKTGKPGHIPNDETREKMAAWQRGRTRPEETRRKISESLKGHAYSNHKFGPDKADLIRSKSIAGASYKSLAAEFGVGKTTIARVVKGKGIYAAKAA